MNLFENVIHRFRARARRRSAGEVRAFASEPLEDRLLLAAAAIELTPNEQLLLELVNRARANPQAEADRYGINLNQGLPPGTISADPKQPLAPNQLLIDVASAHSQDMLDRDYFAHTAPPPGHPGGPDYDPENPPPGSVTFDQRITDSGYDWTFIGENIAWGGVSPPSFPIDEIEHVYERHEALFLSPGHRENILQGDFRELGTGVNYGLFTNPGNGVTYNASMVAEEFGNAAGDGFITGVVFEDGRGSLTDDDFYTIGEQVDSGTIEALSTTGMSYSITVGPSGGYALQVPDGTYTVIASGGEIGSAYMVTGIVISGGRNVKVDFDTSQAPPPPPPGSLDSIVGRLTDGRVWIAASDGMGFTNELWADLPAGTNWQNFQAGDFTGDGNDDLAARDNEGDWWVWTAGTGSFTAAEWGGRWNPNITWSDVMTGDFNGDGRDDIAGRAQSGGWYIAQSSGSRFSVHAIGAWSTNVTWHDVNVGDFNGDGTDDIVGRASTGTWAILQSTGSGSTHTNLGAGAWSTAVTWHDVLVGDFDADGDDDVIGRASTGAWYAAMSHGSGFTNVFAKSWSPTAAWRDARVGDFNGDGRADVAARASSGAWYLLQPTGGTGGSTTFSTVLAGVWSTAVTWLDVVAGDFTGDGRADIAGRASNGSWYVARSTANGFVNEFWGGWSPAVTWLDVQRIHVT
jgi:hypothetical protein